MPIPMSSRRGASVSSKYSRRCCSTSASPLVAGNTSTKRKSCVLNDGCDMAHPSMRSLHQDMRYTRAESSEPRAAMRRASCVTSASSGVATEPTVPVRQNAPVHATTVRGFSQAYDHEGAGGVPLLLVHGWPETRRIWGRNTGALAAAGFEVIAPDLRGFGDSDIAPDGFGDIASHSRDLHALVHDHLGHE